MRVAERDGIWSRGGTPIEELPDPFAPPPVEVAPPDETDGATEADAPALAPRGSTRSRPCCSITLAWLIVTAPLSRALEPLDDPALLLLTDDGHAIARRGAIKEAPVDVAKLDPLTPAAFVAIEDRRFYRHWGIDPRGIGRAMLANMRAGGVRQGGSTITQQLAKTNFLSSDRSFKRKAQEVIIAFWLEAWLTKDEILSRYLSSVYFGDGVYGLRAAAHHYFNRDPEKLTLAQSAMLAGLVQAPSRLAPTHNLTARAGAQPAGARRRWPTPAPSARRARARRRSARPVGRSPRVPTGTYFADWVAPAAQQAFDADFGEVQVRDDARFRPPAPRRAGDRPRAQSATPRPRWSRCGPTARSSRWSAARVTRIRRSTAPPKRGASPARRSSCSSISPRCAPAGPPTA